MVAENSNQVPDHCSYTRTSPNRPNKFISMKSYATLIDPSQSVVKVVQVTDKILRETPRQWNLMQKKPFKSSSNKSCRRPSRPPSLSYSSTHENATSLMKICAMTISPRSSPAFQT
ncbi:Hypothetical predicted protein, partial [Paramuricea clavata]